MRINYEAIEVNVYLIIGYMKQIYKKTFPITFYTPCKSATIFLVYQMSHLHILCSWHLTFKPQFQSEIEESFDMIIVLYFGFRLNSPFVHDISIFRLEKH